MTDNLKWTKEKPSKPGWYLIYWISPKEMELIEVKEYKGNNAVFYSGKKRPTYKYMGILHTYWQGPLEVPEPPEATP